MRSIQSLPSKPLSPWKLMLRDGLNLYGAIWIVNMVNMLFWFIMKPTGIDDPVKTIVTSMAAVLTTSMSLRIILSVRGSLEYGGSFAASHTGGTSSGSRTTHVLSARSGAAPTNISTQGGVHNTYTLDDMRTKPEGEWGVPIEGDGKSSVHDISPDAKPTLVPEGGREEEGGVGVKITIDREVGY
jgi:hypothetical protein